MLPFGLSTVVASAPLRVLLFLLMLNSVIMKSHLMENMSRAYLPTAGAIGDKQPKRSRAPLTVCQISM